MPSDAAPVYRERASVVDSAVVWSVGASSGNRVLPDGCMDLLWLDDELVIAGPDTHAYAPGAAAARPVTGIRLAAGVGAAAFGLPAYEVRDLRVPAADVWGAASVRRLERRVASAASVGLELEGIVAARLDESPSDPLMRQVDALARRGASIGDICRGVGLGERQLARRSHATFGYGPKRLSRIHRFQHAVALLNAGVSPADSAFRAGYADQPHFTREVRALAGVPPGALLS